MTKKSTTRKKGKKVGVSKRRLKKPRSFALVQKAIHGGGESKTWPNRFSAYKDKKNGVKKNDNVLSGGRQQKSIENTKSLTELGRLNRLNENHAEKSNVKNKKKSH